MQPKCPVCGIKKSRFKNQKSKNKERIVKFIQTRNTDFIYKNEFDKACFQHDMALANQKI